MTAGTNDHRAGIAAVNARLHTGRLRVVRGACPNLVAEAGLYRYPTGAERGAGGEAPLDEHNHALAALRYLIARLDARFIARLRQGRSVVASPVKSPPADDPTLWTRLL